MPDPWTHNALPDGGVESASTARAEDHDLEGAPMTERDHVRIEIVTETVTVKLTELPLSYRVQIERESRADS